MCRTEVISSAVNLAELNPPRDAEGPLSNQWVNVLEHEFGGVPMTAEDEFIVIRRIAVATERPCFLQIRVNTTYYFNTPTIRTGIGAFKKRSPSFGMPAEAVGILRGSPIEGNKWFGGIKDVYILPGQEWDIVLNAPSASDKSATVYVEYDIYSHGDAILAKELMDMCIVVKESNVEWLARKKKEQENIFHTDIDPFTIRPDGMPFMPGMLQDDVGSDNGFLEDPLWGVANDGAADLTVRMNAVTTMLKAKLAELSPEARNVAKDVVQDILLSLENGEDVKVDDKKEGSGTEATEE